MSRYFRSSDSNLAPPPDKRLPQRRRRPGPGILNRPTHETPTAYKSDAAIKYGNYGNRNVLELTENLSQTASSVNFGETANVPRQLSPIRPVLVNQPQENPEEIDIQQTLRDGEFDRGETETSPAQLIQIQPIDIDCSLDSKDAFDIFQTLQEFRVSGLYLVKREARNGLMMFGGKEVKCDFDVELAKDRAQVSETIELTLEDLTLVGKINVTNMTRLNLAYKFLCSDKTIMNEDSLIGWIPPLGAMLLKVTVLPEFTVNILNSRIGLAIHPVYTRDLLNTEGLHRVWEMIASNTYGIVAEIHEISMVSNNKIVSPLTFADAMFGAAKLLEISPKKTNTNTSQHPETNIGNLYLSNKNAVCRGRRNDGRRVEEYIILREKHRNIERGVNSCQNASSIWKQTFKVFCLVCLVGLMVIILACTNNTSGFEKICGMFMKPPKKCTCSWLGCWWN